MRVLRHPLVSSLTPRNLSTYNTFRCAPPLGLARFAALRDHKKSPLSSPALPSIILFYSVSTLHSPRRDPSLGGLRRALNPVTRPGPPLGLYNRAAASIASFSSSVGGTPSLTRRARRLSDVAGSLTTPTRLALSDILAPLKISDVGEMAQLRPTTLSLPLRGQAHGNFLSQWPCPFLHFPAFPDPNHAFIHASLKWPLYHT